MMGGGFILYGGIVALTFLLLVNLRVIVKARRKKEDFERIYDALRTDFSTLKKMERSLESMANAVRRRVAEMEHVHDALFDNTILHDLRGPLRSILGFSKIVMDTQQDRLDAEGQDALCRVQKAGQRMEGMIIALFNLAKIASEPITYTGSVDFTAMAKSVETELRRQSPQRQVEFRVTEGLYAQGDVRLLRAALSRLFHNAWKFTETRSHAIIEFGVIWREEKPVYFVRDNGVGFDMSYVGKLFLPFSRLHKQSEFPGEGIGLAVVKRVVLRHAGAVWAEGIPDQGATFSFTLQSERLNVGTACMMEQDG